MIVCISGISGTGKSTIASKLLYFIQIETNEHWTWIDQDSFYKKNKPRVLLSNGLKVSNWDTEESIDWDNFNNKIHSIKGNIIISGFCLLKHKIQFVVTHHFHLSYISNNVETSSIEDYCILSRSQSKFTSKEQREKDVFVVKELVVPFYLKTLSDILPIDLTLIVTENNKRVNIDEIVNTIIAHVIRDVKKRV